MLQSIRLINYLGNSHTFRLQNPVSDDMYLLTDVSGLDSPEGVVNTLTSPILDGSSYSNSRVLERDITISVTFLNSSHGDTNYARRNLYRLVPVSTKVTLEIQTENRTLTTEGWIESNRGDLFTSSEGSVISIKCPKSYLEGLSNNLVNISGTQNLFTFPFSNNSLTENLLLFGNVLDSTSTNIEYEGDVSTGCIFTLTCGGRIGDLNIYNLDSNQRLNISSSEIEQRISSQIQQGDRIVINTKKREKSAKHIRSNTETNILNALLQTSSYIELFPGDNNILFEIISGDQNSYLEVEYKELFQGT